VITGFMASHAGLRAPRGGGSHLPALLPLDDLPAPYFKKHGKRPGIVAFVDGVTAAAVGAIAGAVVVLGRRAIFGPEMNLDWFKASLAVTTALVLLLFKKLPEPLVVLAAALIGLIAYRWMHP
jgi:chromate transporter